MVKNIKVCKGSYIKKLLLMSFVILVCLPLHSQDQLFKFFNSQTTKTDTITGEIVLNDFLQNNEDKWITSIDCKHVYEKKGISGILLAGSNKNSPYSNIIINFNTEKMMKVYKIIFYLNQTDSYAPNVEVFLNGQKLTVNNFDHFISRGIDNQQVLNATSYSKISNVCPTLDNSINDVPMKTLEIRNNVGNLTPSDLQILAFKVNYNGIAEDIVTSVEDLQVESNNVVEYYDMLGRKLSNEPVSGLFIMRRNGKTQKILK